MAKIRVYELAKQLSVSSKEVMDVLKDLGALMALCLYIIK